MSVRLSIVFFVLLLIPHADAKNKKKQVLPDFVLKAQTAFVVINPDAGEPLANPMANRTARDSVENAMMKWGRFKLAINAQAADLIVVVRKGHAGGPTIGGSPADKRPDSLPQLPDAAQHGPSPDLTNPGPGRSANRGPHLSNEIGPSEDTLEVYQGGFDYPLDAPPVWRYMAKDALNGPQVAAVEQFRKAIDESEKQRQQKP
jgi:hypothetical protein